MAPLKFEDEMQQKFEERTIQPSKKSWEKVEFLLEKSDRKKKPFLWMQIAAGFTIMIAAVFTYDVIESDKTGDSTIVEYNRNPLPEETEKTLVENDSRRSDASVKKLKSESVVKIDSGINVVNSKNSIRSKKNNPAQPVAIAQKQYKIEKSVVENVKDKLVRDDSIEIQNRAQQIAKHVASLEKRKTRLTEEEVEALLLQAQKEIISNRIKNSKNIDALALLSDVESELDETFKEKVLEALKVGYKKVRTAVAQRNN